MMNKYLVPMLVVILFLFSSFIVASSPKEKLTIDDEWKYDFPQDCPDILDYSKMTRFVDHYEKKYSWDDYVPEETLISEHPPIMSDSYMDLHMWPMQGYNRQHVGRSPYSTVDNPGIEKWRFTAGDWCDGSPAIAEDGTIYFGSSEMDPYLYAIYPNGTLRWKFMAESGVGDFGSSPAIADDGTIYFSTTFGSYIQAVNPNGTSKWKYWVPEIDTSITIGNDGVIYYGHHEGVDARYPNGTLKWRFSTGIYVESTPAIDEEGIIYFGSHDNFVYALYPNGTQKWKFQTGNWVHGSPTIGEDGTVYVGSDDTNLYALYPNNGTMKWSCNVGSMRGSPSLDKNGNLYFGVWENKIYSVSPDGTINWEFPIGDDDGVWGSTAAVSDDGAIYIGANIDIGMLGGGEIIALNPDGTVKWRKIISDSLVTSSPVIGENGDVYIYAHQKVDGLLMLGVTSMLSAHKILICHQIHRQLTVH